MLRSVFVGLAFAVAAVAGQQGQQTTYPRPTLDTGPVHIEGSVSVTSLPEVRSLQAGQWTVAVGTLPAVETASPDFLRAGHVYRLTSAAGTAIQVRVSEVRRGGWIRGTALGSAGNKPAWYNVSQFMIVADDNEPSH
jgi:hypothetical protein